VSYRYGCSPNCCSALYLEIDGERYGGEEIRGLTTVSPVPTPVEMVTIDPRDLQAAQDRDKAMPPV
jgi:hypothetical protein